MWFSVRGLAARLREQCSAVRVVREARVDERKHRRQRRENGAERNCCATLQQRAALLDCDSRFLQRT